MTRFRAVALVACLLAPLAVVAAASPAGAQSGSCAGLETIVTRATVTITSPAANATVSGTVTVRGTATTSVVGSLNRVEVTFGGVTRVQPLEDGEFALSFDTTSFSPGPTPISVVACGTLARGEASRNVTVAAPPAPTTTAAGGTSQTTVGTGGGTASSVPPTTAAGQAPAGQVAAGPTTTAGTGGSATTSSSVPSTTAVPAEPVVAPRSTTTRPESRADAPLVLTEAQEGDDSGTPLWVGAVVGISGGLGLLFSAVSWRRRATVPEPMEPVDPDLVEVS